MNSTEPDIEEVNKDGTSLRLPEVDIKKTLGLRIVTKAVSITIILILFLSITGLTVIFTVLMEISLEADGILEPYNKRQIHSPASAIVVNLLVESGDTVKTGQTLAILDSKDLEKNLIEVETEIRTLKNNIASLILKAKFEERENEILLKLSEAKLLKSKAAFREKILDFYPKTNPDSIYNNYVPGSHITIDYAISEIKSGEYDVEDRLLRMEMSELNRFEIERLKIKLDKYIKQKQEIKQKILDVNIKSPIDGIILTENIYQLEESFVSEGSLLFEISDTQEWTAVLFVNETDIHEVSVGNTVKIELNALKTLENIDLIEAEVISIAAEQNSQNANYLGFNGLYRVTAKLNLMQHEKLIIDKLKFGFNVKGFIVTDQGLIYQLLIKYLKKL